MSEATKLLAAYAIYGGRLHPMFEGDQSPDRSLKYLGTTSASGEASEDLADWHASSLTALNEHTDTTSDAQRHKVMGNQTDDQVPWYAIFEFSGELWVGRFLPTTIDTRAEIEDRAAGVYAVEGKVVVDVVGNVPVLTGSLASRSLVYADLQAAGGEGSAEGDHGGTGSPGSNEW